MKYAPLIAFIALPWLGCGSGSDDCAPPAFVLGGYYSERYWCVEDSMCTPEQFMTIVITGSGIDGNYTFYDPDSEWNGSGTLCGTTFVWTAEDTGLFPYTEFGTWEFSDANTFTKESTYNPEEGGSGVCTGSATQMGMPIAPPPLDGCP